MVEYCRPVVVFVPYPPHVCIPALLGDRAVVLVSIIVFVIVLLRGGLDLRLVPGVALAVGLVAANVAFHLLGPARARRVSAVDGTKPKQW